MIKSTAFIAGGLVMAACIVNCHEKQSLPAPLFQKDTTHINEKNNTLFAFVGEKIHITSLPEEEGSMDGCVKATYRVLVPVYGNYDKDTISFIAYDHFGRFNFGRSRHALLYVSKYKGIYYHEKYQFTAVYRTKNGRWAGDGSWDYRDSSSIKPEKIDFIEEEVHHFFITEENGTLYDMGYDTPYFRREDHPPVIYGNYIEQLFELKKNGALRIHDRFGDNPFVFPEVQLEEIKQEAPPKRKKKKK